MGSLFDTEVRRRREATPWARVDVEAFLRDAALSGGWTATDRDKPGAAVLTVRHRPDVASRLWWVLEWVGEDGERHGAEASSLDLLMWRAAEMEMRARRRAERDG